MPAGVFLHIFKKMKKEKGEIELPLPDDFHAHLRQGEALPFYVRDLAKQFGRALVMPNTIPPMTSVSSIVKYREEILCAAKEVNPDFFPLMTFKILPGYTESELLEMKRAGVIAGKYYPMGVTTNSEDGISDLESVLPVIALMEKLELVLCIHGEEPSAFCLEREEAFLDKVEFLAQKFPKLKIVLEHLSTEKAVACVESLPETVAATITVHHLMMTLDDVIGNSLRPHHFCKPIPKFPKDREAIRRVVFSGNPKFFLGTDSAPHEKEKKECPCGAAGVYSAPVAIPLLAQEFERAGALARLPDFVGGFGADFYGLSRPTQKIRLIKKPWKIPNLFHNAVPLAAGETLNWSLV